VHGGQNGGDELQVEHAALDRDVHEGGCGDVLVGAAQDHVRAVRDALAFIAHRHPLVVAHLGLRMTDDRGDSLPARLGERRATFRVYERGVPPLLARADNVIMNGHRVEPLIGRQFLVLEPEEAIAQDVVQFHRVHRDVAPGPGRLPGQMTGIGRPLQLDGDRPRPGARSRPDEGVRT
jgi:hypothetical protein